MGHGFESVLADHRARACNLYTTLQNHYTIPSPLEDRQYALFFTFFKKHSATQWLGSCDTARWAKPHHLSILSFLPVGTQAPAILLRHTLTLFECLQIPERGTSLVLSLWFKKLRLEFLIFIWVYLKRDLWKVIILVECVCCVPYFYLSRTAFQEV